MSLILSTYIGGLPVEFSGAVPCEHLRAIAGKALGRGLFAIARGPFTIGTMAAGYVDVRNGAGGSHFLPPVKTCTFRSQLAWCHSR
jgi:hypothetical protein